MSLHPLDFFAHLVLSMAANIFIACCRVKGACLIYSSKSEASCSSSEASCLSNQRPVLAGNSVHTDWWLARRFLPLFSSRLHYRHLDVTALKLEWQRLHPDVESGASCSSIEASCLSFEKENPEIIRRYFPEAVLSGAGSRHDAYYDVQASIAELAFYRRFLLINNNLRLDKH
jgi:oligoribonuclease (3'-5' exoribonuclease)